MKICLNIENEEKRLVDVTEQPTKFSSSFYTDQTREIKIIREAFNSNNFTQLRELPNFKRNALLNNSKQKVFNVFDNFSPTVKVQGMNKYFAPFTYIPTDYDFAKYLKRLKQLMDQEKQNYISTKPFLNCASVGKKLKYNDQFFIKENLLPFHLSEDIFDLKKQSESRQKIISECQRLSGAFKPAGKHYQKYDAEIILSNLKNAIIEDYPTSKFTITNNLANVITVQFHFEINPKELIYYMNALLNDERLTDYQLHKLINDWGIQVNQSIMAFSMKSLWIK
ncbi:unnamed protein product (macronuclear) [Paramecium tetraurelia]|uniref:CDT1 Geminin-binding domain-containing protein n=1 Tax=Paramecium tetraurelia TaxID=5888 RepID=A0BDB5_PARTE|nr:uncharacterized protein GSPATT00004626001 [Paramecium tetraurelia]CAK56532.1 unnamed protein product [Paramecium tetraurelia]|eukprot:XP_001423930.1 hypothetical protein (macronuclear) [Paramecium tetraurelia strain d4-2]